MRLLKFFIYSKKKLGKNYIMFIKLKIKIQNTFNCTLQSKYFIIVNILKPCEIKYNEIKTV